ncbi:MAG: efflux RND transporter periplasmic adaptor subunit [Xanthomonadales bacterium]|nr:efflux RND transporter periplasmic adaptor subunit [Xanthomonadales bacterium]
MKLRSGILILALLATVQLSGCGGAANGQESAEGESKEDPAVPVEVAEVERQTVYAAYEGTTSLEAEQEAEIVAKTGGVLLELLVDEGDHVKAGQIVARLDREQERLELRQAKAVLDKLENEFARMEELYNKKLISRDEYDRVRFDLESQRAAIELSELQLSYTDVRSPISGVISERMVKVGNLIQLHQPMFRVDDFDPLLAVLYAPERELSTLEIGQEAVMRFDALPGDRFVGNLKRISPVVDPETGTFKVTVEIPDPDPRLKPGLFGRVNIVHDVHADAIAVPKDALIIEDRGTYAFVVDGEKARRVNVSTGYTTGNYVEVLEGLEAGQLVVTAGKGSLADETRIELINAELDSDKPENVASVDDDDQTQL